MNTIGFNNFKAFGEKMQYFPKKPIVLVYGPNSIGKSSFLHSQLYLEYLIKVGSISTDIKKTNFAGDTLDLNGFENYIHKHEKDRFLKYEIVLNNMEDIAKLLSFDYETIRKFKENGLFDLGINEAIIREKLDELASNDFLTFGDTLGYINAKNTIEKSKKQTISISDNEDLVNIDNEEFCKTIEELKKQEKDRISMEEEIFNLHINACLYKYLEKYKLSIEDIENDLNKKNDFLEKLEESIDKTMKNLDFFQELILYTKEDTPELILNQINFIKYLLTINETKLSIDVHKEKNNKKLNLSYKLIIDNEVLFGTLDNQSINVNHSLFQFTEVKRKRYDFDDELDKKLNQAEKKDIESESKILHFLFHFSRNKRTAIEKNHIDNSENTEKFNILYTDYKSKIIKAIHENLQLFLSGRKDIQYFGPLRFYPQRKDLIQRIKIDKKTKERENLNIDKYFSNLKWLPNRIKLLFFKKPLVYINFPFWIKLYTSNELNDVANMFLPESMKRTLPGATTSRRLWSELIASEELQEKLNMWLSDTSKLKTTYRVTTIDHKNITLKLDNYINRLFRLGKETEKELVFIDKRNNIKVTPRDMGLGVSQVMPVLLSAMGNKNTNIYLEQPELHLHPTVQAELADEFIRSYKENNNEFLIETHSEHLLLRIMKRMRYTAEDKQDRDKSLDLTFDDVCLLYVDSHKGKTFIRELELDKDGSLLSRWPSGFFEESYNEMFS